MAQRPARWRVGQGTLGRPARWRRRISPPRPWRRGV